jgi:hypothetical protein
MRNTKLKYISNVVYKLKRSYGLPVDLHSINTHDVDVETGVKTTTHDVIHIRQAPVLSAKYFMSFVYDLAYISANKDFTTGAIFDPSDRGILLDAKDLNGYEPKPRDFVNFQDKRYDVFNVLEFENNRFYVLFVRRVEGSNEIFSPEIHSGLLLEEELTHTLTALGDLHYEVVDNLGLNESAVEVP